MRRLVAVLFAAVALCLVVVIGLAQCDQPPVGFDPPHPDCAPTPYPAADGEWLACCSAWCVSRTDYATPLAYPTLAYSGGGWISDLPLTPIATVPILSPTPTPTGMVSADWYLSEVEHYPGGAYCYGTCYSTTYALHYDSYYCSCSIGMLDPSMKFVFTSTGAYVDWIAVTARWQRSGDWCATASCECNAEAGWGGLGYKDDFGFSGSGPPYCGDINETRQAVIVAPSSVWLTQIVLNLDPEFCRPDGMDSVFEVLDIEIGVGLPPGEPTPTPTPETPTPTYMPPFPTPQFPEICATPAMSVPLIAESDIITGLTIIPGECRTIIPGISQELPGGIGTLEIPGFELCYDWLVLPTTKILGWTIPLGTLISLVAAAFLWRLVNQQFGG
jgi:hypothetical protein